MYMCTAVEMYKLICLGDTGDKEDTSQMQMRLNFNNINVYICSYNPFPYYNNLIHYTCGLYLLYRKACTIVEISTYCYV